MTSGHSFTVLKTQASLEHHSQQVPSEDSNDQRGPQKDASTPTKLVIATTFQLADLAHSEL